MELIMGFEWVCEEIWAIIARLNDKKNHQEENK